MTIKVITDSSCDLPDEILARYNIAMVPLRVCFENSVSYLDRYELSPAEFFAKMKASHVLPKTAAPDPVTMMGLFKEGLKEAGEVLFISLSSELSATNQVAHLVCEMMGSDKIQVFDGLSVSLGTGVLAIKASQMAGQGFSMNDIMTSLEAIRKNTKMLGVLDTLDNVIKGGRLNKYEGMAGNLLKIKPILRVNQLGVLEVKEKARGNKRVFTRLLEMIGDHLVENKSEIIIGISHLNNYNKAQELAFEIKKHYNPAGEIIIADMGATIGTYAGDGALFVTL
jgi:DegV family protein with EDD domain